MNNPIWTIRYDETVVNHDIPNLDHEVRKRIRKAIETKLMTDPYHFGKPLRYSLSGQRSLRVGDYRVLYLIDSDNHIVSVVAIGHRRDMYES